MIVNADIFNTFNSSRSVCLTSVPTPLIESKTKKCAYTPFIIIFVVVGHHSCTNKAITILLPTVVPMMKPATHCDMR